MKYRLFCCVSIDFKTIIHRVMILHFREFSICLTDVLCSHISQLLAERSNVLRPDPVLLTRWSSEGTFLSPWCGGFTPLYQLTGSCFYWTPRPSRLLTREAFRLSRTQREAQPRYGGRGRKRTQKEGREGWAGESE